MKDGRKHENRSKTRHSQQEVYRLWNTNYWHSAHTRTQTHTCKSTQQAGWFQLHEKPQLQELLVSTLQTKKQNKTFNTVVQLCTQTMCYTYFNKSVRLLGNCFHIFIDCNYTWFSSFHQILQFCQVGVVKWRSSAASDYSTLPHLARRAYIRIGLWRASTLKPLTTIIIFECHVKADRPVMQQLRSFPAVEFAIFVFHLCTILSKTY